MGTAWKTDLWWVSPYNYFHEATKEINIPKKVLFHDTTLRDGEQEAGIVFRKDEKVRIAKMLDEAGVDRIEAGMPRVSSEDFEAIKTIAHEGLSAKVFCLSRCMKGDVDLALSCDVDGIEIELPTNDYLIENAYGWSVDKALNLAVEATSYAHEHGLYVSFFTLDSTRAPFETFWRIVNAVATEGHMDACTVVDTFGAASPHAMGYLVKLVKEQTKRPVEIHCHNDFGLATANTIMAVLSGAEVIHTAVNSIGERVGNASLEELVLALKLLYGIDMNVRLDKLRPLSKLVQEFSGVAIPPHKPIVGDGIFTVESGIVVAWWRTLRQMNKHREIFPFKPELVGHEEEKIVLGKKSSRDSILCGLERLGLRAPPEKTDELLMKVKRFSEEKKGLITDDEFAQMVEELALSQQ